MKWKEFSAHRFDLEEQTCDEASLWFSEISKVWMWCFTIELSDDSFAKYMKVEGEDASFEQAKADAENAYDSVRSAWSALGGCRP